MAILSKDDYFSRLHERLAEDTSDDAVKFLEDMTDTYNDLDSRASGDGTDWEKKYHDLDESWKKKYRSRFFSGNGGQTPADGCFGEEDNSYKPDEISVDSLFS